MALPTRLLNVFSAVAKAGGAAAAGRRLGLSPASVSEAVKDLEAIAGQPLFDRSMRRLRLNAAGAALSPRVDRVLDELEAIERELKHQRVLIEIGASVTVGNFLLASLLLRLIEAHPAFDVSVTIQNTQAIADAVEKRRVAIAFVEGTVDRSRLDVRRWRLDDLTLVAPKDHPFAGKLVSPDDLREETWVLREEGSGTRATFDSAIGEHLAPQRIVFTVGGNELLKQAVLGGGGIGCISREAAREELDAGRLVELRTPWLTMRRDLSVVLPAGQAIDPPLASLLRLCGQTAHPSYASNFARWR